MPHQSDQGVRTFDVLGVPLRSGSLVPGNENDARAYRDAGLVQRLNAAGCRVVDAGDLDMPSYLPHHSVPPIRNWPGPRIVWDRLAERLTPLLEQPDHVPLLIGCDCSVVVGSCQALQAAARGDVYVLYVDGDVDSAEPDAATCSSAAAAALWLLTRASPFWVGPSLPPSQLLTVLGCGDAAAATAADLACMSLDAIRQAGPSESARRVLAAIPESASILLHLDVDVLQHSEMPAAYFPHNVGMRLSECAELLGVLLHDPRLRVFEVAEYAALRDADGHAVSALIDVLTDALSSAMR